MDQEYISQVSEEFEGRVNKELSKEFSISGALSKFDESFLTLQVRICSVAVPGTSRNNGSENRQPTGDRSTGEPCPEVVFSALRSGNQYGSELEATSHLVTGVLEEIPFCSPGTSSGKQKKARSTNQPQFRNEKTPATNEADQILLALQQLATNSKSANFNNSINRIANLPKSLKATEPTFDGNLEKLELLENLFQTSLKIHNQQTEEDKINYFHSLMRGDALETLKNITSPNRKNLGEILTVFRRKYVKLQSMATTRHKFQRLVYNSDELQINTLTQQATQQNPETLEPTSYHCKKPGHYRKQCRQLERGKDQARNITNSADNNNNKSSGQTNSYSNNKIIWEYQRKQYKYSKTQKI